MPLPDHRLSLLHKLADSLCSVLFPTECSICRGEVDRFDGLGICGPCWLQVEPWLRSSCECCGLPIVSQQASESAPILCGQCRLEEFAFDGARVFGLYRGSLRAVILQLKFYRRELLARRLGALLALPWKTIQILAVQQSPLLVPVPLFRSRERERGFNQARLLAQGLARQSTKSPAGPKLELATRVLVRTRSTLPQSGLNFSARRENVRGAFSVRSPERVRGREVVLVDDVMTTGATLSACAKALKQAGARRVLAVALARATPQFPDVASLSDAAHVDELRWDWT